jgi:hypothetical protein
VFVWGARDAGRVGEGVSGPGAACRSHRAHTLAANRVPLAAHAHATAHAGRPAVAPEAFSRLRVSSTA